MAKDCYLMKLYLLTNATIIDNAIRLVTEKQKSNEELTMSTTSDE